MNLLVKPEKIKVYEQKILQVLRYFLVVSQNWLETIYEPNNLFDN